MFLFFCKVQRKIPLCLINFFKLFHNLKQIIDWFLSQFLPEERNTHRSEQFATNQSIIFCHRYISVIKIIPITPSFCLLVETWTFGRFWDEYYFTYKSAQNNNRRVHKVSCRSSERLRIICTHLHIKSCILVSYILSMEEGDWISTTRFTWD